MGTILSDKVSVLALLACFMTIASIEFFVSFLTLHLSELGFLESQMGFWFTTSCILFLPACLAVPVMFKSTPPRLQIVLAFFINAFSIAMTGPSKILSLSDSYLIIAAGLLI